MADMTNRNGEVAGLDFDESIKSIKNTWGHEQVSAGLTINGSPIALGFNFKEVDGKTSVELSGDFYGTGLSESAFIDELAKNYQRYRVENILEQEGYTIDEVNITAEGEIELIAEMWA